MDAGYRPKLRLGRGIQCEPKEDGSRLYQGVRQHHASRCV
uniref:Uncharacterized protein n=1 Tax=Siphoviridae sp. ct2773 TaxID=2826275 RepID=A0A8S5QRG5_9CAUD|nr:MAG TPA: hypothetical protein [Siphoviridae sp. ct2773]DAP41720.1 MAG TPA: hypothetical protein [Caudoviricetes sp.]